MQPKKSLQLLIFSFFAHNLEPTGRAATNGTRNEHRLRIARSVRSVFHLWLCRAELRALHHLNVGPVRGRPDIPKPVREARAGTHGGPPDVILHPGDVGFAVAVKVADDDVLPGDGRAPTRPGGGVKRGAASGGADIPNA